MLKENKTKNFIDPKTIWKLYYSFGTDSCVHIEFLDEEDNHKLDEVTIWKGNETQYPSELQYPTRTEAENRLYELIGHYALKSRTLDMKCNYGFGLSVHIRVFCPAENN